MGALKHGAALLGDQGKASALEASRLEAERMANSLPNGTRIKQALQDAKAGIPGWGPLNSEESSRKENFPKIQLGIRQGLADTFTSMQASGKQIPDNEMQEAWRLRYDPDTMLRLQAARDHVRSGQLQPGDLTTLSNEVSWDKNKQYTGQLPHSEFVSALRLGQ